MRSPRHDGNASRRHAEIAQEGSVYVLVDLGSTNGTELNGRRVTRQELADGDRITIGATDLVFSRCLLTCSPRSTPSRRCSR